MESKAPCSWFGHSLTCIEFLFLTCKNGFHGGVVGFQPYFKESVILCIRLIDLYHSYDFICLFSVYIIFSILKFLMLECCSLPWICFKWGDRGKGKNTAPFPHWTHTHPLTLKFPGIFADELILGGFNYLGFLCSFPGGSDGKESACNMGNLGLIPWLGISPGEGNGNPLQYSCLESPMDGGAWQATVHGVIKSWTRLSDFTFLCFRKKLSRPHFSHILWYCKKWFL